ncbi:hypothetical protein FHX52_4642 [Humibacillus xanthopallidus]|uniref:Uncharacterized protein n=1 Tax=Humibacillus xanthopallidus TaxID=412689 RepID=A0A543PMT7_9MICO|nr:hypothetical protein [Humibacillus xanthopallidus]TQN45402.1 hypothetical protein FHX52_4642 [Humibacillus xanthopallidus]
MMADEGKRAFSGNAVNALLDKKIHCPKTHFQQKSASEVILSM